MVFCVNHSITDSCITGGGAQSRLLQSKLALQQQIYQLTLKLKVHVSRLL